MEIREAVPEDSEALKALQAKCPQGTDLIASIVNTPDFFSRVKAYEFYKVYIACEGDRILGSAACGFKNAVVNGSVARICYGFQDFVAPEYRRTGVASKLHCHREAFAAEQGASLFYAIVIENNTPAMRYIERRGFHLHRTIVMPGLALYKQMDTASKKLVRPALPADLNAIAALSNKTWQNHQLHEPLSVEALSGAINRTPGYDLSHFLVLEEDGEVLAFLGYQDWSQIMKITVESTSFKMRMMGLMLDFAGLFKPMPRMTRPGETLNQVIITLAGFDNPAHLLLLFKHLNNQMLQKGIDYIFFICDRDSSMLKGLKGFIRIDTALNLYVKNLHQEKLKADKPIFINGVDL